MASAVLYSLIKHAKISQPQSLVELFKHSDSCQSQTEHLLSFQYRVGIQEKNDAVPRYLFNYFNVRNHDSPRYKTRSSNGLILEKVNLECTKRAFFYKGATIFNYSH